MSVTDWLLVVSNEAASLVLTSQEGADSDRYIDFLNEELGRHRDFLESLIWKAIVFLAVIGGLIGGIAAFMGWKSFKEIKETAQAAFDKKISGLMEVKETELDAKILKLSEQYQRKIEQIESTTQIRLNELEINASEKAKGFAEWLLSVQSRTRSMEGDSINTSSIHTHQFRILWVDDNPDNNTAFSNYFSQNGMIVIQALDTDGALKELAHDHFDVVISDMGRKEGADSGLALLDKLKQIGAAPQERIIFASQRAITRFGEKARALGATLTTSNPGELVEKVMKIAAESG